MHVITTTFLYFTECDNGKYGKDCGETCPCDDDHTDVCDKVSGGCTCSEGWTGKFCNIDVDKCKSILCQENAVCKNQNGIYGCDCNKGYWMRDQTCEGMDITENISM